ncbi:MAG: maleylacetate reductase [Betaproteobacteria bacterium]|nr:maleylacetate reductase [Betaproteobacteria bacterium]
MSGSIGAQSFVYNAFPVRVVFGTGSVARLPEELDRLGAKRALILSTPGRSASAKKVAASLGARVAGFFDRAQMHTPLEVAEDARRVAKELGADACVTVGGGSTIGLGKAIALTSSLPVLAVPTTYSGSEMTPIYGLLEGGMKRTGRDARVLPKTVIYDPELLLGLPAANSAASGMNAMAHCVEALYAHDGNPITSMLAEEGIRALAKSLPEVVRNPDNLEARGDSLYGAWLAGVSLASAGMALHHKLCHTLGGSFGLPHAETHAIVLPHAARYNRDAAREAMQRTASALGVDDAPTGLYDLELRLGLKLALKDLGLKESDLDRAAKLATESPYPNPAPLGYAGIRAVLEAAFHGRRPL